MVQPLNTQGICATCNDHAVCLSPRNSLKEGKPIFQCEEFDDSGTKMERKPEKGHPDETIEKLKNINLITPQTVKGLCMNCGHNHICNYPCFGKNVLYCKEYV